MRAKSTGGPETPPQKKPRFTVSFAGLVIAAAALAAVYFAALFIARSGVRQETLAAPERKGLAASLGEIAKDSGDIVIAEDSRWRVVLDTGSLNIRVEDTVSGWIWNALPEDAANFPAAARSPLVIKYLGRDNTFYEWDAYTNVITPKQYTIERIKNGARIRFDFHESRSYRLGEYMPERISIARYEEAFEDRLEKKVLDGSIDAARAQAYRNALRAVYARDDGSNSYYNKFSGLPPASVVRTLVEFSGAVEYTTAELIRDSDEFGIAVIIEQPASFVIYMEAAFKDGELTVNIPVYEQQSGNDFYTLQNISVFPAFDAARAEENEGFIFVPDGAGMLISLDSYNSKYPDYNRPLYNNTLFDTKFEKSAFDEELHIPVFGMYRSDGRGFMGIIESGAELARIAVKLKSKNSARDGALYNAVYAHADTMQYSRVKIFGPYAADDARYLASTGLIPFDFTIRYRFYPEAAGYYAFARDYRDYLIRMNHLKPAYDNRPKLFLELAGAVTLWDTFLGVPFHPTVSMTTYRRAGEILDDLEGVPLAVNYKWGFNGGRMNFFGDKAKTVSVNGGAADLSALLSRSSPGGEIFMEASLMRVYRRQTVYNDKRFYALGYSGSSGFESGFNDVWYPDKTWYMPYDYALYYLVHPRYLSYITDRFLRGTEKYPNISLTDFGSHYYGSYNPRDIVDPVTANQSAVLTNLKKIAAEKKIALDNPNADKFTYAAYSLNVSRESGNYGVSYTSIPFRQLVMSGLTEFTTLDVNGARSSPEYFLLQALELGALPKFTVFAEKADVLINARISQYFAAEYGGAADTIKSLYEPYRAAFEKIGTKEIAGHETIAPNVFRTIYANGVKVLVNYNLYGVNAGPYKLGALGFMIEGAVGETY
ncbi:MAG: DUF5696 domain-containing protein [Treponema sp.]|jgi:hypothetical protein|nr:DUF5696 domain-containing protein [Treponema sp.]